MRRRPPRTLPSKGCGREWTTGTGEVAPRRALDPKPRVRMILTLRWCGVPMGNAIRMDVWWTAKYGEVKQR